MADLKDVLTDDGFNHESLVAVMRAVRHILRVPEGESILDRTRIVMSRYDSMNKDHSTGWE